MNVLQKIYIIFSFPILWGNVILAFPVRSGHEDIKSNSLERIYVQTDRTIYAAGEHVFFKLYLLNSNTLQFSHQSQVAYLVFRNTENTEIRQLMLKVTNGIAYGSFYLPDTLHSDYYQVVAFTNLMKNSWENSFFSKQLFVANQFDKEPFLTNSFGGFDHSFSAGLVNIKDSLLNDIQYSVVPLSSLTIEKNKKTYAKGEDIKLKLKMNGLSKGDLTNLSLSVSRAEPIQLRNQNFKQYLSTIATSDVSNKLTDSLTNLKIIGFVTHKDNGRGVANCGVVISDSNQSIKAHTDSMGIFKLVLDKGFIWHKVKVQFEGLSPLLLHDLEIHFYRMNKLPIENSHFQYKVEHPFPYIQGYVINSKNNMGIAHCCVTLSAPDSVVNFQYTYTDSLGLFSFPLNHFYDGKNLILGLKNELPNQYPKIELINKFELLSKFHARKYPASNALNQYISQCQDIVHINKVFEINHNRIDSMQWNPGIRPRVYYKAESVIIPGDYVKLENFGVISQEITPTLKIRKHKDQYYAYLFNDDFHSFFNTQPCIFINGVYTNTVAGIMGFGTDKIKRIEMINKPWFYGDMEFNGVLSVFTTEPVVYPQVLNIRAKKFSPPASYIEGLISGNQTGNQPDFRELLYWNPNINLKGNGSTSLGFKASALTGTYIIKVEGITSNGQPLSAESQFNVN